MNKKFFPLFSAGLIFASVFTAAAAPADFKTVIQKVDKGGEFLMVNADMETHSNFIKKQLATPPRSSKQLQQIIGLRLQRAAGTTLLKAQASSNKEVTPGCWVFKTYNYIGRENMQLPSIFSATNTADRQLDFTSLPSDTILALSVDINMHTIYKMLYKEFTSQEDQFKQIMTMLPMLLQQHNINLDKLLTSLSGTFKLVVAGSDSENKLITVDIPDKNGVLTQIIKRELQLSPLATETTLPLFGIPAQVRFGRQKITLFTLGKRNVRTTLAAAPEFVNYISHTGIRGNSYLLINVQPALAASLNSLLPQPMAKGIEFKPFSMLAVGKYDPAGYYCIGAANFSATKACSTASSLLAGMLLPTFNKARQKAQQLQCSSNLKTLAVALHTYSSDHNNMFPEANGIAGLQKLIDGKYLKPEILSCQMAPVTYTQGKLTAQCPYIYIGGALGDISKHTNPGSLPVAFEKPGYHKDQTTIVFADGHVVTLKIEGYNSPSQVIGHLSKRTKYPPQLLDKLLRAVAEN